MSETYEAVHSKRYELSLEWISQLADAAENILDLGGESPFTKIIQRRWPGKLKPYYGGDVRRGFVIPGCDLVLCQEVLEHVSDLDRGEIQAHMLLASCWLCLKPGGHLFLTTPNCCSITAIHHALNLVPPMIYRPHVREYAPFELDEMIRAVGFEIIKRETFDVWRNAISVKSWEEIRGFIKRFGYSEELRGEDIFCLARRPLESKTAA